MSIHGNKLQNTYGRFEWKQLYYSNLKIFEVFPFPISNQTNLMLGLWSVLSLVIMNEWMVINCGRWMLEEKHSYKQGCYFWFNLYGYGAKILGD